MINKENEKSITEPPKEPGYVDTAKIDVQCHIIIRDKDTSTNLLNKRG